MTSLAAADHGNQVAASVPRLHGEQDATSLMASLHGAPQGRIATLPNQFLRQIIGLNPFKTSYFTLFRPLQDVQSKLLVTAGVFTSTAGGIPLPIIGVIFGKLIDSFPPSEHEIRIRVVQLISVGT